MHDVGLTHIALPVTDLDRSLSFYARYANMRVVHRRAQSSHKDKEVAWITDGTRPFVIVLLATDAVVSPLLPMAHLGVACATRQELDRLCACARQEDVLLEPPIDSGPPVGYWALLRDPDGHTLELSFGQQVADAVGDPDV
jgi:catechol 2,3-dioxygenase-like lactoylglutathione lyase family enzyme